ncbi:MAG: hypothetical protein CMM41_12285 [Rhodospirillaceae bacterium]|nr:hypothetical protein [Rhodospirillaceae bacterium]
MAVTKITLVDSPEKMRSQGGQFSILTGTNLKTSSENSSAKQKTEAQTHPEPQSSIAKSAQTKSTEG